MKDDEGFLIMTTEIVIALITFGGVILSIIASLFTSLRATRIELQKLRVEIQQTYADKLIDKRLEAYKPIYVHISGFIKKIRLGEVTKDNLEQLRADVEALDTQYSLYFSGRTGVVFHRFLMLLADLTQLPSDEILERYSSHEEKRQLRHSFSAVELALKNDLGIYAVEFDDISKQFSSYQEIVHSVEKSIV